MAALIAYATKHGMTERCARALEKRLPGGGDLWNLKDGAPDLSGYDAVILGTSVYAGMPRKEFKQFVAAHGAALAEKRLGLFLCCMLEGEQAQRQLEAIFPPELRGAARAQGVLGGGIQPAAMNFWERIIIRMVSGEALRERFSLHELALEHFAQAFGEA